MLCVPHTLRTTNNIIMVKYCKTINFLCAIELCQNFTIEALLLLGLTASASGLPWLINMAPADGSQGVLLGLVDNQSFGCVLVLMHQ